MSQQNNSKSIKGILLTGSKNASKSRRVSWGEPQVKEFGKNEVPLQQPHSELNLVEEESISNEISSNERIPIFSKKVSRYTIQNFKDYFPNEPNIQEEFLEDSKEEIKDEQISKKKNNRFTIAAAANAARENDENDSGVLQEECKGSEENTKKSKRYTLSLKEAYEGLLDGTIQENIDDDDNDDITPVTQEELMNNTNINANIKNFYSSNDNSTLLPSVLNVSTSKDNINVPYSGTNTPRISMSPTKANKMSFTDKKLTDAFSEAGSQPQPKQKRITILNARDAYSGSHKKINPSISKNIIMSPITKLKPYFNKEKLQEKETVGERLQKALNDIQQEVQTKLNLINTLKNEIAESQRKQREFENQDKEILAEKNKLINEVNAIQKNMNEMAISQKENKILDNFFGISVLTSGASEKGYKFDLIILKRIKLSFVTSMEIFKKEDFEVVSLSTLIQSRIQNEPLFTDQEKNLAEIQKQYEETVKQMLGKEKHSLFKFRKCLKEIIKYSGSYLNLIDMVNSILIFSHDALVKFEGEKMKVVFVINTKKGFSIKFLFEINSLDSFLGISFVDYEIIGTQNEKIVQNVQSTMSQVKEFLTIKNKALILYRNFFINIYETVINI